MKWYTQECEKVLVELNSSANGLSSAEAEDQLLKNGKNKLAEGKKVSLLSRFFSQLADPMILVLLAAAVLSAITAIYSNESFADVFIILFVVLLNAILGVIQESKAEQAPRCCGTVMYITSRVRTWWWVTWCCWKPATRYRRTPA